MTRSSALACEGDERLARPVGELFPLPVEGLSPLPEWHTLSWAPVQSTGCRALPAPSYLVHPPIGRLERRIG